MLASPNLFIPVLLPSLSPFIYSFLPSFLVVLPSLTSFLPCLFFLPCLLSLPSSSSFLVFNLSLYLSYFFLLLFICLSIFLPVYLPKVFLSYISCHNEGYVGSNVFSYENVFIYQASCALLSLMRSLTFLLLLLLLCNFIHFIIYFALRYLLLSPISYFPLFLSFAPCIHLSYSFILSFI